MKKFSPILSNEPTTQTESVHEKCKVLFCYIPFNKQQLRNCMCKKILFLIYFVMFFSQRDYSIKMAHMILKLKYIFKLWMNGLFVRKQNTGCSGVMLYYLRVLFWEVINECSRFFFPINIFVSKWSKNLFFSFRKLFIRDLQSWCSLFLFESYCIVIWYLFFKFCLWMVEISNHYLHFSQNFSYVSFSLL